MSIKSDFFRDVDAERNYQHDRWGATDHLNDEFNWAAYIGAYTNRSLIGHPGNSPARREAFKQDMVKVAALALAAVENLE